MEPCALGIGDCGAPATSAVSPTPRLSWIVGSITLHQESTDSLSMARLHPNPPRVAG
jgi:hypothetical protein